VRICYLANASSIHTSKWAKFFVSRKHEVHVVSFEDAQIGGAAVHVVRLPVHVKNAAFALKIVSIPRVRTLIKRIDPDVLHAHYVTNYGLFGALCGFKPFVITAWGSDVLIDPQARFISMIKRPIAHYALRRADMITCDADHMKQAIASMGISSEKITLIYFGIDNEKFSPQEKSETVRAKLGLHDSLVVISLRNLERLYDVESLVRSVPLVLKDVPEAMFIIAGRGSEEKKLRELAKSLGVSNSVKFIGFIPNNELPQYLNTVDVYVSTSLSDAGIAASTAEAMSCGLPVIVTDVADNKKWVKDGVNGFVLQTKDHQHLAEKIIYLLKNEDLRKRFGRINRKIIDERNNYYKEMDKMERIYEELVQRHEK
jgi:glycosyltransferase involved in cell wall biosynthesis